MLRKSPLMLVLCVAVLSSLSSCITHDDNLDLSKKISLDMSLGKEGEIILPLNDLGKYTLDSLIKVNPSDTAKLIQILDDDLYGIRKRGNIKGVEVVISPLDIKIPDPQFAPIELPFADIPPVLTKGLVGGTLSASFSGESKLNLNEPIDKAVLSVSKLEVKEPAAVSFSLSFNGLPSGLSTISIENLVLNFPDCIELVYSGTDSRVSVSGKSIELNGVVDASELEGGCFRVNGISFSGLSFNPSLRAVTSGAGKRIVFSSDIDYSGTISVAGTGIDISQLGNVALQMKLSVEKFSASRFVGRAFPSIDKIGEKIPLKLDDDIAFLKSKDNEFEVSDIRININLEDNVSAPLLVDMSVSSKSADGSIIGDDIRPDYGPFEIPAAPDGGILDQSVVLSNQFVPYPEEDEINVLVSDFDQLLTTVPDTVSFDIDAETDTTSENHSVHFGTTLYVTGNYEVLVPFKFNSIKLNYLKSQDVYDDLKDVRDKLICADLRINADVINTVPMDVRIKLIPLDGNGKELPEDIMYFREVTVSAGTLKNPQTTNVNIVGMVKKNGLPEWHSIKIQCYCESDEAVELKRTEGVSIKNAQLFISNVNIDLSDKNKE